MSDPSLKEDDEPSAIEGESETYNYASILALKIVLRRLLKVDTADADLALQIDNLKLRAELALKNVRPRAAGLPHLIEARRAFAAKRREEKERKHAMILPIIDKIREEGATLWQIARALNDMGVPTTSGGKWSPSSIRWVERSREK